MNYFSTWSDRCSFIVLFVGIKYASDRVFTSFWIILNIFGKIWFFPISNAGSWSFATNLCATVSAARTSELNIMHIGLIVSKRGDLPKEKVCFVADLLLGDWLMVWKDSIDLRQYLSFIKFIMTLHEHNHRDTFNPRRLRASNLSFTCRSTILLLLRVIFSR